MLSSPANSAQQLQKCGSFDTLSCERDMAHGFITFEHIQSTHFFVSKE